MKHPTNGSMQNESKSSSVGAFREVRVREEAERKPSEAWSPEQAKSWIEAWRSSGQKLSVFARQHGFSHDRLRKWLYKLETSSQEPSTKAEQPPLPVMDRHETATVTLKFPQGTHLTVELPEGALIRLVALLASVG